MTLEQIAACGYFTLEDMDVIYNAYQQDCGGDDTAWKLARHTYMKLPEWYDCNLDPMSDAYLEQQNTLWRAITGVARDYVPELDEQHFGHDDFDPVLAPGWHYAAPGKKSIAEEAEHMIAAGMIMKHSGILPGQRVLEYGAGFGKASVLMARLGAVVDTVDISEYFCSTIQKQADFFKVPLTPFVGKFGFNPRGDQKYDLIFFYECFHHCVDFKNVLPMLKQHLAPNGKIIMAGEPIVVGYNSDIPYDWGFRLNAENLAIMRYRRWYELGFTEEFIQRIFTEAGFAVERMDCPVSAWGKGYIFRHKSDTINMASHWLPDLDSSTWHSPEPHGRWSTDNSYVSLDTSNTFSKLNIDICNHHPVEHDVTIEYGDRSCSVSLAPGKMTNVVIDATIKAPKIYFKTKTLIPAECYPSSLDRRALGVFVNTISYVK